jgi:hypothetical protein
METRRGWRFSLRIPSWSQAQIGADGEVAVFYQVQCNHVNPVCLILVTHVMAVGGISLSAKLASLAPAPYWRSCCCRSSRSLSYHREAVRSA